RSSPGRTVARELAPQDPRRRGHPEEAAGHRQPRAPVEPAVPPPAQGHEDPERQGELESQIRVAEPRSRLLLRRPSVPAHGALRPRARALPRALWGAGRREKAGSLGTPSRAREKRLGEDARASLPTPRAADRRGAVVPGTRDVHSRAMRIPTAVGVLV